MPWSLYSTKYHSNKNSRLSSKSINIDAKQYSKMDIAVAYYDSQLISFLLENRGRTRRIRLLVGALGGLRLKDQIDELNALKEKYKNNFTNLEIKLSKQPGIFHTKLFVLTNINDSTKGIAYIGSANATVAALGDSRKEALNEELCVKIEGKIDRISEYFNLAWEDGRNLDGWEDRDKIRTLIQFFRMGSLYFKPTATLAFTHNPFSDILGKNPDLRNTLARIRLPDSDVQDGITSFNIARAINRLRGTSIDIDEMSQKGNSDEVYEKGRESTKPFRIETCLGYWVPNAYSDQFIGAINHADKQRRRTIGDFLAAWESTEESDIVAAYKSYLDAAKEEFSNVGFETSKYKTVFSDISTFKKKLQTLSDRINRQDFIDRLCSPWVQGPMPEIWVDSVATRRFTDTFFEYIEFVSGEPRKPRVVKSILNKCGEDCEDAETIQRNLEKYLAKSDNGWSDSDWLRNA